MSEEKVVPPTEEEMELAQNIAEGEESPTGPEFEPDVSDDDLEMIESSPLMAESDDQVDPDEEFDVEPTGDDPDEDDEEA